jgi:hypothetical protein
VKAVLATVGFGDASGFDRELGYEKVAIYTDPIYTDYAHHFARQKWLSGKWTSKLGWLEDIEHADLSQLEGVDYGYAVLVVKRTWWRKALEAMKLRLRRLLERYR